MELKEFIENFAEQFDETDPSVFKADTIYHDLEEWSSLIALCVVTMVADEYNVNLKGEDIRDAHTIEDLFNTVKSKM
ncbi:MAG: acyl carrier protein [Prevotella sp.]|nr:acyl carrier protein [Prevotella sp.]